MVRGSSSRDLRERKMSRSLSNWLTGEDVGELTGVTVRGSLPFLVMGGETCGGEEDDMKMGIY